MRLSLILGVTLVASACSDGGHDDDTSYNCAEETRADEFVLGLTKTGAMGRYEFKLLSSDPAPPARGDNILQLQLSTMAAPTAPVTGAAMSVTPFMPDHKHGSSEPVIVKPMSAAGQYELAPVNLWMPGLWEVTIRVNGAESDSAVFRFCLAS
jgi:YtkA-like